MIPLLFQISGNEKTLNIHMPIVGRVADINPAVLGNPSLISMAPYQRGWILTVAPIDMPQASRELLSGRSAKEWLKRESLALYDMINEETAMDLGPESPIPNDFARMSDKDIWRKIDRTFFVYKGKRRGVRLYGIDTISSTLEKGSSHPRPG